MRSGMFLSLLVAVAWGIPALFAGEMADQIIEAATRLTAVPAQYEQVRGVAQSKANPNCAECNALYQNMTAQWAALDEKQRRESATLDQRARRQEDYLHYYTAAAQEASSTVGRFAEQANRSGPGGSLCGRCAFAGGGRTAPTTAAIPVPRDQIVAKYVDIFWETHVESERIGFRDDTLVGKAFRPLHRQSESSHRQETEKYVRQVFSLMGEREARELINEELRESWARQRSSKRFEQKYGSFLDSY